MADKPEDQFSPAEIAGRRDDAIRRALNTPPKPLKELVGRSERAIEQRKRPVQKSCSIKAKSTLIFARFFSKPLKPIALNEGVDKSTVCQRRP